jgi:hypothetical protein
MGGKQPLSKSGWGTDKSNNEVDQPNHTEAEDDEGRLPSRFTAVRHFWSAISSQVEQPGGTNDGEEGADEG